MTSNPAFEPTAASALRLLAVSSALRASAAAQRQRWASREVEHLVQTAAHRERQSSNALRMSRSEHKEIAMKPLRFFIDTHDRSRNTFPPKLTPDDFELFFAKYEKACYEEGVVPLRAHVGYDEGRAFCFNMAPDAESVRRAHERAGLPFDSITEVTTATPGDMFFRRRNAA